MPEYVCSRCGKAFEVNQASLDRYPGWTPKICLRCKRGEAAATGRSPTKRGEGASRGNATPSGRRSRGKSGSLEENLTIAEVLARYHAGPQTGVFTDGAAHPNPGAGGWGAVYVVDNEVLAEKWGHEALTTNNRMELSALLAGIELVPRGTPAVIYTDSELCVKTFNQWAKGWEKRGWKRKEGEIKNLELVKRVYTTLNSRPELTLTWIAAHSGNRWNEYADALATAYRRTVR